MICSYEILNVVAFCTHICPLSHKQDVELLDNYGNGNLFDTKNVFNRLQVKVLSQKRTLKIAKKNLGTNGLIPSELPTHSTLSLLLGDFYLLKDAYFST